MKNLFTPPHSLTIIIVAIFLFANQMILAQSLSVTLTPSNHNDFNITCFGAQDGSITANASYGMPPYTYSWSNEATTQTISNLAAGYYHVIVHDNLGAYAEAEITLVEPTQFRTPSFSIYMYANYKNVSCFYCNDGSIATSVETGIAPYTFEWADGPTTQDRTNLFAGQYTLTVTDANGCTVSSQATLYKPDRDDWQQNGNTGTNPSTQYIGTSDNKDLVFKTNASERLKIKANGQLQFSKGTLKVDSASADSARVAYIDQDGILRSGGDNAQRCTFLTNKWYSSSCTGANPNDIFNYPSGNVGIGTVSVPNGYKLAVKGNVIAEKVYVQLYASWPDYVFKDDYKLMPLSELESFIKLNKHLPDMPSAEEVEKDGHDLGDIQTKLLKQNEELTLHIIELNKRIDDLVSKISKK